VLSQLPEDQPTIRQTGRKVRREAMGSPATTREGKRRANEGPDPGWAPSGVRLDERRDRKSQISTGTMTNAENTMGTMMIAMTIAANVSIILSISITFTCLEPPDCR
jgi:hypothetical protein